MRGTLAIANRELTERRTVLAAALVAGLVPFTAPLLPGVSPEGVGEVREAMALIVAAGFSLGLAVALGGTAIGRDLAEGRLSFDFSRPLHPLAIWAGRLLAALALVLLVAGVALLPTTLFGGGVFTGSFQAFLAPGGLALLAAAGLLLPLAHALGVAFRTRSGWLAADLLAAVAVVALLGAAVGRLYDAFAMELFQRVLVAVVALTIAALWAASAVQVARGRTDLRRGHRALSFTLWPLLLAVAAGAFGFQRWIAAASPADLEALWTVAPARGDWVLVTGPARGRGDYYPALLIESGSERFVRLGAQYPGGLAAAFSGDGRRVAWVRVRGPRDRSAEVVVVDLDKSGAARRTGRIGFPTPPESLVLSADGARLAALRRGTVAVFATDSGGLLASARLPTEGPTALMGFVAPDRLRVALFAAGLRLFELDVAARTLTETGRGEVGAGHAQWNRERDRLLVGEFFGAKRTALLDGRTGETLATFDSRAEPLRRRARFLDDGRIVVAESDGVGARLRLYDRDGLARQIHDLGRGPIVQLGAEAVAGAVAVTMGDGADGAPGAAADREVVLVDLATGSRTAIGRGLSPLADPFWGSWGADAGPPAPGSAASRLFVDAHASLLLYEPAGADWRRVAGRVR